MVERSRLPARTFKVCNYRMLFKACFRLHIMSIIDQNLFLDHEIPEGGSPLVSVVVPTFKRPDLLAELLSVLIPQMRHLPVEVLVVDNCACASALETMFGYRTRGLRYVHERRAGVVHARNRGIVEAQGDYVLFLDDDQVPAPGWLNAFVSQARAGVVAAFGRITARYCTDPEPGVAKVLDTMFTRDFDIWPGADLTGQHPVLGCGNSMFRKDVCLTDPETFRADFNHHGGEDSALIRDLVQQSIPLNWVPDACVEEVVPDGRQTLRFLKARRFNQGRLRSTLNFERGVISGVGWMCVGIVQSAGYATLNLVAKLVRSPRAAEFAIQQHGGLGKMLWWCKPAYLNSYAG